MPTKLIWILPCMIIAYLTTRTMTTTPNLPTEMWDIIFDYKNAMETKDKHNALTKDLIGEINTWAVERSFDHNCNRFQDYRHEHDVWWWMTNDGTKDVDHHAAE